MEIPDISTYQMRFAIEEGAWIVMFRSYFPNLLKNQVGKLEKLEEMIWNSSKALDEDYAFYLIELENVTKLWVNPLLEYWLSEHDFGKPRDFAIRLTSSIFSISSYKGINIYDGGLRLFQSKMEDLDTLISQGSKILTKFGIPLSKNRMRPFALIWIFENLKS